MPTLPDALAPTPSHPISTPQARQLTATTSDPTPPCLTCCGVARSSTPPNSCAACCSAVKPSRVAGPSASGYAAAKSRTTRTSACRAACPSHQGASAKMGLPPSSSPSAALAWHFFPAAALPALCLLPFLPAEPASSPPDSARCNDGRNCTEYTQFGLGAQGAASNHRRCPTIMQHGGHCS